MVLKFTLAFFALYLLGGFALYFFQRFFVFNPHLIHKDDSFDFKGVFEESFIDTPSGNHINTLLFKSSEVKKKGLILYFHGNSDNLNLWGLEAEVFTSLGYDVFMYDYPTFGKSTGELAIGSLLHDAHFLTNRCSSKYEDIVLYGRSLGTGIATYVASKQDRIYKALVLETPYYSMRKMAETFVMIYPLKWIFKFKIKTYKLIKNVHCPIFAFHGTNDELIPIRQARRLKQENPSVDLTVIEHGTHNDLPLFLEYQAKLDQILL